MPLLASQHLDEDTVLRFVAGRLSEPDAVVLHEHIDTCESCRALVAMAARRQRAENDVAAHSTERVVLDAGGLDESATVRASPRARPDEDDAVPDGVDEYEFRALLGQGGMGRVFLAHDRLLDRLVAIKLIAVGPSEQLKQRLAVEARAVARIKHPNVVAVHRVGEGMGVPYIVYEYVEGRTLKDLERPMPWARALSFGIEIARGLEAAHAGGVLHRDLKPANVMVSSEGDVVLVDFGLAKIAGERESDRAAALDGGGGARSDTETRTGVVMGTPRYMAPEAWRGERATPETDIYSLGVMLFELCAGRSPYEASSVEELATRMLTEDAPALREVAGVPPALGEIVDRCLRRDPKERFASAAAVRAALEEIARGNALAVVDAAPRKVDDAGPYRGALPFEPEHHGIFFGRRSEIRDVVEHLKTSPFVLVVGPRGAGKSSLCRAGVAPAIVAGALGGLRQWTVMPVLPGRRPARALERALSWHVEGGEHEVKRLAHTDDELGRCIRAGHPGCDAHLVLIDQLEELVTVADVDEARRALAMLAQLTREDASVRVLATIDAEHLTRVAAMPEFARLAAPTLYLTMPPRDAEALREIITAPAQLAGVSFEPALVDALVARAQSGELSLAELEHVLAELWSRRGSDDTIRESALDALGDLHAALARHAERTLATFDEERRAAARRILAALAAPDGRPLRRPPTDLGILDLATEFALEALLSARLVTLTHDEGDRQIMGTRSPPPTR